MGESQRDRYYTEYLQGVFSAKDNEELAERYDASAPGYDERVASSGYVKKIPLLIVGLMCRHVKPGGLVLDAGAGTGLIGEMLMPLGYKEIVGIDLSEGMLEEARKKGLYGDLKRMVLGEPLDFPDDLFSAVVASGVFNVNHAPPEAFNELVRVTRPEGHVVFTVRDDVYEEKGFKEKQESLESEGKWVLVDMSDLVKRWSYTSPLGDDSIANRGFVYRVV